MTQPADTDLPHHASSRTDNAIMLMLCAYVMLASAGFALLRSPFATAVGSETSMSIPRALFFVANSATNTGFQTSITPDSLRWPAQATFLVLMIAGALLNWLAGGLLICRALRLPVGLRSLVCGTGGLILLAIIAGIATARGGELFPSIFRAISAVCNGGVWLGDQPQRDSKTTLLVLLPLAILGGLGMTVLVELVRLPIARRLSRHATLTLFGLAAVYIAGAAAVMAGRWLTGGASDWPGELTAASVWSLNTRSAGLPIELINALDRPTQWIAAALMLVGAGSGGAGGGLKVTTLLVLAAGVLALLRDRAPARVFAVALCWLGCYMLLIAASAWLLLWQVPEQSADRLLMLAISAAGNVGLSHDVLPASGNAAYILSATMFAGRLLPLVFLAWLASRQHSADVVVA